MSAMPLEAADDARHGHALRARLATVDDAPESVRLAGLIFTAMGIDLDGGHWQHDGITAVRERLGDDVLLSVVNHPQTPGRLIASAAACVHRRLPRPGQLGTVAAYVQWVATDPAFRRRGLGRMVMTDLLERLAEQGVETVDLHATPMAESLYLALGFRDVGPRALRITPLSEWIESSADRPG